MFATHMECLECKKTFSLNEVVYTCPYCSGLLDVKYDYEALEVEVSKPKLEARKTYSMWRYSEFLPINVHDAVTLWEGFTPLSRATSLERLVGFKNLYLKFEFLCPTGSFKDRGSSVLISKAKGLGAKEVTIDSSGNAASSISCYAARAQLRCFVFVPSYASTSKLIQIIANGATVFAVEGTRRDTYEIAKKAYENHGWYYCGFQTNPFASEGLKTIAYEICEQLNWNPPDKIVIPVGTAGNLVGCWKGLEELYKIGWIHKIPSLVCIQPEGCAPIAKAHKGKMKEVTPIDKPETVAEGLMIGSPFKGKLALKALEKTRGLAETVSDNQIIEAGKLLAKKEGVFVEPSAAASVAGIMKMVEEGQMCRDETIVCLLTGSGLKTQDFFSKFVEKPIAIKPDINELRKAIKRLKASGR
ncbi:MAG: Threonine synthase [Candidatus Bathyarchaeota archaeon BA1]|nr:MAG: Threonine synthase [Candidatus Bathyarchaeota archaeon BA1]